MDATSKGVDVSRKDGGAAARDRRGPAPIADIDKAREAYRKPRADLFKAQGPRART